MIRWILQISVMLIDIGLAAICVYLLYEPEFPLWLGIPAVYLIYRSWKSQGGPIAWTHRKEFMENAKKLGI
jgi:hypothetical protein